MTTTATISWNAELVEQMDWHWRTQLRRRLEGLTDEEYLWEPVPSWSVRARGSSSAPVQGGTGTHVVEFAYPEPVPAPFTTIAWRMAHMVVGVLGMRNASHFGREPVDYLTHEYAATAADALAQLDAEYAAWLAGVRSLGEGGLSRPCGPSEGPFADRSMAALVLHITRELVHHGAEVCLLRDLYLHSHPSTPDQAGSGRKEI
jgi:hypothetical protein